MAISIGDAILFLSADDKNLKKGLKSAEKTTAASTRAMSKQVSIATAGISNAMTGMAGRIAAGLTGILGISALKNYANEWIQLGDALEEQSQRTGLSVEMLSKLNYVAGKAGTNMQGIEIATKNLARNLSNTALATGFFGKSLREIRTLSPDQQFMRTLEILSRIEDPTLRAANALKIFGKSGTDVLPLIVNGMNGLNQEMLEASQHGTIFTAEEASNAAAYADAIYNLHQRWVQLGGAIATSPIGKMILADMEGLTAIFDTQSWSEFLATLDNIWMKVTGLTNKKQEAEESAGEKSFQDAKARNEAARAGKYNPASSDRDRELMRQAMIFANGETGVSAETRGTGMYPNEPAGAPGFYDRSRHYTDVRRGYLRGAKSTISERQRAGDYYGSTFAQRYGISEQELAARNTQYNTIVISHATFTAGDDMIKAYNRKQAMRPGI